LLNRYKLSELTLRQHCRVSMYTRTDNDSSYNEIEVCLRLSRVAGVCASVN